MTAVLEERTTNNGGAAQTGPKSQWDISWEAAVADLTEAVRNEALATAHLLRNAGYLPQLAKDLQNPDRLASARSHAAKALAAHQERINSRSSASDDFQWAAQNANLGARAKSWLSEDPQKGFVGAMLGSKPEDRVWAPMLVAAAAQQVRQNTSRIWDAAATAHTPYTTEDSHQQQKGQKVSLMSVLNDPTGSLETLRSNEARQAATQAPRSDARFSPRAKDQALGEKVKAVLGASSKAFHTFTTIQSPQAVTQPEIRPGDKKTAAWSGLTLHQRADEILNPQKAAAARQAAQAAAAAAPPQPAYRLPGVDDTRERPGATQGREEPAASGRGAAYTVDDGAEGVDSFDPAELARLLDETPTQSAALGASVDGVGRMNPDPRAYAQYAGVKETGRIRVSATMADSGQPPVWTAKPDPGARQDPTARPESGPTRPTGPMTELEYAQKAADEVPALPSGAASPATDPAPPAATPTRDRGPRDAGNVLEAM